MGLFTGYKKNIIDMTAFDVIGIEKMDTVNERILKLIQSNDISYGDLSARTDISKSALQRYATGETKGIPFDKLEIIAHALNTTPAFLMGWESESDITTDSTIITADQNEVELIDTFRDFNSEGQAEVIKYIRLLALNDEYKKGYQLLDMEAGA